MRESIMAVDVVTYPNKKEKRGPTSTIVFEIQNFKKNKESTPRCPTTSASRAFCGPHAEAHFSASHHHLVGRILSIEAHKDGVFNPMAQLDHCSRAPSYPECSP